MRRVHVEWGVAGAAALAEHCPVIVVCDVLSFTTTVSVAAAHGVVVVPHAWQGETAAARAASLGAVLAGPRGSEVSLSPTTMRQVASGNRVVLPSPNGAACCLAAEAAGAQVVAGCLRNVSAVAAWCRAQPGDIGVVAAGERWPDDTLRPAYEDWVGAGALIAMLGVAADPSPEAEAAAAASAKPRSLAQVASGMELIAAGYADDVAMAEAVDADDVVPVLESGCFVAG